MVVIHPTSKTLCQLQSCMSVNERTLSVNLFVESTKCLRLRKTNQIALFLECVSCRGSGEQKPLPPRFKYAERKFRVEIPVTYCLHTILKTHFFNHSNSTYSVLRPVQNCWNIRTLKPIIKIFTEFLANAAHESRNNKGTFKFPSYSCQDLRVFIVFLSSRIASVTGSLMYECMRLSVGSTSQVFCAGLASKGY